MAETIEVLKRQFYLCFIQEDRYMLLIKGLGITLKVTVFALIIGVVLGVIVAIIRTSHDSGVIENKFLKTVSNIADWICKLYLTVVRGTPSVVQLLIWYFVILAAATNKVMVACIAFGINSSAYVAEIMRAGIQSVDPGQMEAGRSLGMNYVQTMRYIILPQAFKNVLPALGNEMITLLKETAISGYIALQDLTKAGDIIRGRTFISFMPLIAVAVAYLCLVLLLTWLLNKLERRLRSSDSR